MYYKIVNSKGGIIGVAAGETPMAREELYDSLHNVTYTAVTYQEYLEVCSEIGAEAENAALLQKSVISQDEYNEITEKVE